MVTLSACDCVEVDGYLYFFSVDINLLYKLEISTGEITPISSIPEENIFATQLCSKIIYHKGFLYLTPLYADKIWRYSLVDGIWKGYELKKTADYIGYFAFNQAVLHDDNIFFFGSRYPAVVVLDLINEEMKYCEGMYTDYLKKQSDKQVDVFFIGEFVYINNLVYIASCLQNMILKFNLNTLEHEYIQIGDKSNHYAGIGYDGSYFYLSPRNKKDAVKWDGAKKSEIIKLKYLTAYDDKANVGVFCEDGKVKFYGMYEDRFEDLNNGIDIIHEKYRFYKRLNTGKFVSLNEAGKLTFIGNNKEYKWILQVDKEKINDYVMIECKKRGEYSTRLSGGDENLILVENELLSLKLYKEIIC